MKLDRSNTVTGASFLWEQEGFSPVGACRMSQQAGAKMEHHLACPVFEAATTSQQDISCSAFPRETSSAWLSVFCS